MKKLCMHGSKAEVERVKNLVHYEAIGGTMGETDEATEIGPDDILYVVPVLNDVQEARVRAIPNEMGGWDVALYDSKHWRECAINSGGTECNMGSNCGNPIMVPRARDTGRTRSPEKVAALLLDLFFAAIKGQYLGLTVSERGCCTEEEFKALLAWIELHRG